MGLRLLDIKPLMPAPTGRLNVHAGDVRQAPPGQFPRAIRPMKMEIAVPSNYLCAAPSPTVTPEKLFHFLFVGSMSIYANEDAVNYFCDRILPILRRDAARPFVVDAVDPSPSGRLHEIALRSGVRIVGPISDVRPWYDVADAVIVPLRNEVGKLSRILEAFEFGCPVITTKLGAEGLDIRDGEHVLMADEPDDFAKCCSVLLNNPALGRRFVSKATNWVRDRMQPKDETFAAVPLR